MARKKAIADVKKGPTWLITYSDLVTLLLTFFVLMISMAVIDERRKIAVLGSVSNSFISAKGVLNPKSPQNVKLNAAPGAMTNVKEKDLQALKDTVFGDNKDLEFRQNSVVTVISISNEVLFAPGSADLSAEGIRLLDKIFPHLQTLKLPILIAGHTGPRRDEDGARYRVNLDGNKVDDTWDISFERCMAVYRHYSQIGYDVDRMKVEAFGQYRPHFSNLTEEGRQKNRRVDLVIDTREQAIAKRIERERSPEPMPKSYYFKNFKFELNVPEKRSTPPAPQQNSELSSKLQDSEQYKMPQQSQETASINIRKNDHAKSLRGLVNGKA